MIKCSINDISRLFVEIKKKGLQNGKRGLNGESKLWQAISIPVYCVYKEECLVNVGRSYVTHHNYTLNAI